MGVEANKFTKRLAGRISMKKDTSYSKIIAFVRKRLRFDLAKPTPIPQRSYQGKPKNSYGDLMGSGPIVLSETWLYLCMIHWKHFLFDKQRL